jgi:hypothetical protein
MTMNMIRRKVNNNRKMRKALKITLFLLLLGAGLLSGEANAQHYIGVRGGYGGGRARFEPRREMRFLIGFPSAGISWKYYSPEPIVGGIQVDLQYVKKGYRELQQKDMSVDYEKYNREYDRTVEAIEMPFFWQIHFYGFQRHLRAYLNLGVYASYIFRSEEYEGLYDTAPVWKPYPIRSVRDNSFEYGLAGGVGFSLLFNRMEVFAEARYSFGYSDLLKASAKYPGNERLNRSPIDMINVSVGCYFRLGKGDILAPPPGTNRLKESWDTIPAGRNRESSSGGGQRTSSGNTNSSNNTNRGINPSTQGRPSTSEGR